MVATPKLAHLAHLADNKRWRVVLIGDPHQLAAVGRGGMFTLLAETGPTVELETVHRFRHRWERDASLRLRQGDPGVIDTYYRHGRLDAGPREAMEREALDQWQQARTLGRTTLLLATTNVAADRLNTLAQHARLASGGLPARPRMRWANGRCVGASACLVSIWSTPKNPGNHANRLRQRVRNCPHEHPPGGGTTS